MTIQTQIAQKTLGADVRTLRKARGLTLSQMAESMGRSVGWLSQVERDLSTPTAEDIAELAKTLDVSEAIFGLEETIPEIEQGYIVRANARRDISERQTGLKEGLLSPDLTDDFEMIHSVFEPGSKTAEPVLRATQEVAYIIQGKLDLVIGGRRFTVGAGDSFRIRGEIFEWSNPYPDPAIAIWVIAPPVY